MKLSFSTYVNVKRYSYFGGKMLDSFLCVSYAYIGHTTQQLTPRYLLREIVYPEDYWHFIPSLFIIAQN